MESYFNIVSFGSTFSKLRESSLKNGPKTIELAISEVEKMGANFGGTEIAKPLA